MSLNLKSNLRKICDQTKSFFISLFEWLSHTFILGGSLFAGFCKKYKIILCSFVGAVIVSLACWVRDNIPTTYFESLDALSYLKQFHAIDTLDFDSVCYIDVSNYHDLVKEPIHKSISEGDIVVTRRNLIVNFLKDVKTIDYKFLFIDIFFGLESYDSNTAIYDCIKDMKNVIVSCPPDNIEEDPRFTLYSAPNSYYVPFFSSGHTRSWYITDDKKQSVPVRMYNALHNNDTIVTPVEDYWYDFKFLGDSCRIPLCFPYRNSPITFIPYIDGMEDPNWGFKDIYEDREDYLSDMDGKIVIVGDMYRDDLHSTYVGNIPGSVLTYLQYVSLQNRCKHEFYNLLFFVVFFVFIWVRLKLFQKRQKQKNEMHSNMSTFSDRNPAKYSITKKMLIAFQAVFGAFITSFIGYSVVFGIISWIMVYLDTAFSTFVPSLLFSLLEWMLNSKNSYDDLINKRIYTKI